VLFIVVQTTQGFSVTMSSRTRIKDWGRAITDARLVCGDTQCHSATNVH